MNLICPYLAMPSSSPHSIIDQTESARQPAVFSLSASGTETPIGVLTGAVVRRPWGETIPRRMLLWFLYAAVRGLLELLVRAMGGEADEDLEIVVLRHELAMLRRQAKRVGAGNWTCTHAARSSSYS
jgi:hypothetical protein